MTSALPIESRLESSRPKEGGQQIKMNREDRINPQFVSVTHHPSCAPMDIQLAEYDAPHPQSR
jgi:hypothetical protein